MILAQTANEPWWIDVIKAVVIVNIVMGAFAYLTWVERKLLGRMHLRYGPNRVGPFGLLQPIADLMKLLGKASFFPAAAIDVLYLVAPLVAAFTALAAFSVIPFGGTWEIGGYTVTGVVADVPISLILIFALGAMGIYAFVVGGWASESKYSLLGSMRTCAQLVSYEVSLGLAVLGVVLMSGTLSPDPDRHGPAGHDLVHRPADRRLRLLLHRGHRRDEPRPVRPARRPSRSSSPATTPSTAGCAGASSRWPSTST